MSLNPTAEADLFGRAATRPNVPDELYKLGRCAFVHLAPCWSENVGKHSCAAHELRYSGAVTHLCSSVIAELMFRLCIVQ